MARTTTASNSNSGGDDAEPKASKRRCVPSACVPCRKRKSKCDGGTPVCATCTAVYKTECHYDEASESRRGKAAVVNVTTNSSSSSSTAVQAGVKRDTPSSASQGGDGGEGSTSEHAEFLIKAMRSLPESEVADLIQHIRRDSRLDIPGLAEAWRRTATLPFSPSAEQASLEGDLALLMGKPSLTPLGESRHFGHTSHLGLVPDDENYTSPRVVPRPDDYRNGTWTSVTHDIAFVERLLHLYFQWSHPFYVIFSRECFYRDFQSGRRKYCSPLLVNAILAYACHFSDEPQARTDPHNPRTAGDHFFSEARRLLYEDETPSLTTVQALCVMAIREPSMGRDSSGFMYIGRCMRMAVELGLHLNTTASPTLQLTASEIEVRKVTFWGCFVVDTVWTICIGRIAQLPRSAITLEKPILEEETYHSPHGVYQIAPPCVISRLFLQEFSSFAELINDNNFMFFAPKERFTSRRLLSMYEKYQRWHNNLPLPLRLPEQPDVRPLPHIIVLHMLYYTVILHLFRPMLKVDLIGSEIRPRDMCIEMANKVSELLRLYRKHYDLRACQLVLTHILLSISIVHLLYSQNSTNSTNLIESLKALEDLSICHYFGARSFKIVHTLAKTWNLPWPEALKLSKLIPKEDAELDSPPLPTLFNIRPNPSAQEVAASGYAHSPPPPGYNQQRRESLSMFAAGYQQSGNPSMQSTAMQAPTSYAHPHQHITQQSNQPLQFVPNSSTPSAAPSSTSENAETLFWTPVPGVGVPIFPRDYRTGPMDLNNMLGNANEWDRFGRDGFKMSAAWPTQEQTMGYAGGILGGGTMNMAVNGNMNVNMNEAQGSVDASAYTTASSNSGSYSNVHANITENDMAPSGPGYESWWPAGPSTTGGGGSGT